MCTSETKTKAVVPLRQTKILDYMKKIPASKFTTGKRKSLLTGEVSPVVKLTSELDDRNAHDCSLNSTDRQDCYEIVRPFLSVNGFGHWHNLRKRAKVDYTATKISGGEDGNKEVGKELSDDHDTNQQGRNNIAKYDRERHESGIKKKNEREKRGTLGRHTSGEFDMKGDIKRRQKERSEKIMCSHGSGKKDEDKDWNFKGKSKVRKLDSNVNNDSKQDKIQTDKQMCSDAGDQKLYSLEDKCPSCRYTGHTGGSVNTETEKTAACNTTETVQNSVNIEKPIYGRNDHTEAACALSEELTDISISCSNLKTVDIVEKEVEDGNKKIDNFFRVKKTAGSVQKVDVTHTKDYPTVENHDPVIVDRVTDTNNSSNKLFNFYMTCPVPIPEIDFDITDYLDVYNFQIVKEKAFGVVQTAVNEKGVSLEITRNKAQVVEKLPYMGTSAHCYNESDNGNKEAKSSTSNARLKNLKFQSNKVEVNQKTDSGEGLCSPRMETSRDTLNIAVDDEASYVEDISDMYSVWPSGSLFECNITEQIQGTRSESGKCTGEHTGGSESTSKNPSTTDASPTEVMPLEASSEAEDNSVGVVDEKSHLLVGSVVWGRFSKNVWWPALVLEEKLVRKSNKNGFVWLYWFSDEQYSQVKECFVDPFYKKFLSRCRQTNNKKMKKGISLALQICACRAEVDVTKYGGIDGWVQADDGFLYKDRQLFQPKSDDAIPDYVFENLGFTPPAPCYQTSITNSDNTNEGQEPVSVGPEQGKQTCNTVCNSRKEVCSTTQDIGFHGDSDEGERCLACDTTWEVCNEHPLFVGKICRKCKEVLRSSFYAIDDDECSMFCCICGEGGSLYVCDDILCGKAYCFICVARHSSPTTVKYVKDAKCWNCFLCTEYSTCTHGRLVPQEDWSLELVKFFQAGQVPLCDDLQYMKTNSKRKLRVLSMFDGIGT
ncbi:uncharacterized protein LOC128554293, partial [Mercenaria mercenaria]|uniref:uncharacterized protein LOC128554293 n=1 Tax=Mercenaria mercenaria TaxID=6596 RepID=UPI00234ECF61